MLLSEAVREGGALGGGVPMLARALNEFMLCSSHAMEMSVARRGSRKRGRAGCWEAGRSVFAGGLQLQLMFWPASQTSLGAEAVELCGQNRRGSASVDGECLGLRAAWKEQNMVATFASETGALGCAVGCFIPHSLYCSPTLTQTTLTAHEPRASPSISMVV